MSTNHVLVDSLAGPSRGSWPQAPFCCARSIQKSKIKREEWCIFNLKNVKKKTEKKPSTNLVLVDSLAGPSGGSWPQAPFCFCRSISVHQSSSSSPPSPPRPGRCCRWVSSFSRWSGGRRFSFVFFCFFLAFFGVVCKRICWSINGRCRYRVSQFLSLLFFLRSPPTLHRGIRLRNAHWLPVLTTQNGGNGFNHQWQLIVFQLLTKDSRPTSEDAHWLLVSAHPIGCSRFNFRGMIDKTRFNDWIDDQNRSKKEPPMRFQARVARLFSFSQNSIFFDFVFPRKRNQPFFFVVVEHPPIKKKK